MKSALAGSVGSVILVLAACSHEATPVNTPQLPPDKADVADKEPAPPAANPKPAPPPTPPAPPPPPAKAAHDAKIAAVKPAVKLLGAGTGKKQKLAVTGTAGAKLAVDLSIGVGVKQGDKDQTLPDIVMHTDTEVGTADKTAAAYKLTVSKVDVHDVSGETRPPKFEDTIGSLVGLSIAGSVHADGSTDDIALHHDAADANGIDLMEEVMVPGLLPMWPVLPADAVGPGAKWEVTTTRLLRGKLAFDEVIDFELVSATAKGFEIKGTIKLSGKDQDVDGAKVTGIAGVGTFTMSLKDGLFGTSHQDLKLVFVATVPISEGPNPKTQSVPFEFRFANDLAPTTK